MSAVDVIRKCAATNSRTEKEQIILDAWMSGEREFFKGVQLAYDILLSFGVKQVPAIAEDDGSVSTLTFQDFLQLADKLSRRELTGSAAKTALREAAEKSSMAYWNEFLRPILLKDLRCGVSDSTVNKLLEKLSKSDPTAKTFMVPEFCCQLAKDGADPSHAKKVSGKKMLDVKLDGVRLLTVLNKEEGTVVQYTRNGKVNANFTHITGPMADKLLEKLPGSIVLDGEITGKSFQELMTQVNRTSNKDPSSTKLALFDIIPLVDFQAGKSKMKQKERHAVLSAMAGLFNEVFPGGEVYVIPKLSVDLDTPEGQAAFTQFNKEAIAGGYEGIMVKDPEAPYEGKRTAAWLKIKPFIEVSLEVYGMTEGEGKLEGSMGNLLCRGTDDGKYIEVSVGGGFSDEQRKKLWAMGAKINGFIAEIRADVVTQDRNNKDVWSLRFPRFKGFRGHEPGEKL